MSIRKKINRPVNEEYGVRNPASASCVLIITFPGRQNARMGSEGQKSTPFERAWTAATAGKYIQNCRRVYPKLSASISITAGKYTREIILNTFEICYDIFVRNNEPFT